MKKLTFSHTLFSPRVFSIESKTVNDLLKQYFSTETIAIITDTDRSKYPKDIQRIIYKIRTYLKHNNSIDGIKNMMERLEKYRYTETLRYTGARSSAKNWWIIHEHQPSENLTPIEKIYRDIIKENRGKLTLIHKGYQNH